jgi:hypothetical protein
MGAGSRAPQRAVQKIENPALVFPAYETVEVLVRGPWHDPELLWFRCRVEESV